MPQISCMSRRPACSTANEVEAGSSLPWQSRSKSDWTARDGELPDHRSPIAVQQVHECELTSCVRLLDCKRRISFACALYLFSRAITRLCLKRVMIWKFTVTAHQITQTACAHRPGLTSLGVAASRQQQYADRRQEGTDRSYQSRTLRSSGRDPAALAKEEE